MDTTKFTMGIVGLVVIILMVTGAVLPAVEDAQKEQYSTANNTDFRFKMAESSESIVIASDATGVSVNGTHYNLSGLVTIAISPTIQISYYSQNGTLGIQDAYGAVALAVSSSNTITLANNTYTVDTVTPATGTFEGSLMVIDGNGKFANYYGTTTDPFFINNDGKLTGYIQTSITVGESTVSLRGIFEGTIDNLKFVSAFNNTTHEVVDTAALSIAFAANSTPTKIDDLHSQVTGRSFDVVYTVEDVGYTATVADTSGIIAPIEYKYIGDNDASIISLIGIIPLLLIIVAVLYAVRLMGASRN